MKRLRRVRWIGLLLAAALGGALFVYSQAPLTVGYAVVTPRRGAPAPIATALFTFRNAQEVLVSEAAVAAVEPISRGRIFVDQRGADTGIAVANPSNQPVVLDLVLRDVDGQEIDSAALTLPARAHVAEFVNQRFQGIADDFIGSLTFETRNPDQGVGAVTIRQGVNANQEPLFATLPVVNLADGAAALGQAGSVVFPHIGAGSILSTQIILINRTSQRTTGLIRLTASSGQPLELDMNGVTASQFPYELEPNGVFFAELTSAEDVQQGYAVVTASQGSLPAGTAVFRFTSGGVAVSEAGVAEIPPTRRARIFVDNNNTQTGVAIANNNDRAVDVTFDLLDRNGLFIEQTSVRIPIAGHIAIFADQLFELPANFTGQIEINALREIVPITLKFTTNQRGDFILTTLPVADFSRLVDADLLIFPQVGFGSMARVGSFFTRLIFINLDEVQAAGGTLAFFRSPDGAPLELPLGGELDSEFGFEVGAAGARQFFPGVESNLALIIVDEANLIVNEGETSALRPITLDEEGNARDDFALTFSSLAPGTVSVDSLGTLRGLSRGFSTVTISSQGVVVAVTVTVATITGGNQGLEVTGIAQDFARRVYLSNTGDHTILTAEDVTAPLQLWAGRERGPGFVNDLRLQSRFNQPAFIALNQADGSLFVSDSVNHAVRIIRIGDAGEVETLAGDGQPGAQDGSVGAARFNNPQGLALDPSGNLWVADSDNHTIRRIRLADGVVETIAGLAGVPGLADGAGPGARFNSPRGIALDAEPLALQLERAVTGDPPPPVAMIVADTGNNVLRRVREDGTVETVDDSGDAPEAFRTRQGRRPAGPVVFNSPEGVVVDEFGNIFVSEPTTGRVRALLRDGQLVQAAQTGTFGAPRGLAVTTRGRVVVAEDLRSAQEIRYAGPSIGEVRPARISASGGARVVTVTGTNFAPDTLVVLGGVRIGNATVDNTSTITFTAPENLPSGRLTLTLQHRGGLDQAALQVDPVPLTAVNPGEITTVAGGTAFGGDLQLADRASLGGPAGAAFDSEGNLFVADADHNRIRRVDAITRIITTVLGQGPVRLDNPQAVALDASENLYIADTENHLVLRLRRSDGSVTRLAGTGADAFGGDGGPALQASLSSPSGIAVASNGDVYVSDTGNGRIRRISAADGTISSVADAGDAPLGAAPAIPKGIAFDRLDNLYVADEGAHAVWRIDAQGNLERFAGSGHEGFSGDNGPAATARLSQPADVAVDSSGNVLIADAGNHRVRRVSAATGFITTAAGTGVSGFAGDGGAAQSAVLNRPAGLAFNGADDAFVADSGNGRVRRIAVADGTISTYAGNGLLPDVGDGIAAGAALNFPLGVALDDQGRLLIADSGHHRVRRVFEPSGPAAFVRSWFSPAGEAFLDSLIETVAGNGQEGFSGDGGDPLNASLNQPAGVAFDPQAGVIIADAENHRIRRVRSPELTGSFLRLSATSVIDTIAGTGMPGFSGDGGSALGALLNAPHAVLSDGLLFIADRENHRIRRVDLQTGVISTIAGNGQGGFSGDGGPAVAARLNGPRGLALRGQTLLVADTDNHRIRRVDLASGVITTIAGDGTAGFSGDGGPAASASLNRPTAAAFDLDGGILIGDAGNHRIRRVDAATSRIATIAGVGAGRFSGDAGPAVAASLSAVGGLAVDSDGNIYFSDSFNHRIRAIRSP